VTGGVRWVDQSADFAEVVATIGAGPLAVDTEADSFHHYQEKVCLVQLSFGGQDVLVDPLAEVDLGLLQPALENPGLRKIVHGADYDVRMLHRDFDLEIRGLFDTMLAARLVGERAFGLSALLRKFLNVELDKRYQRADWSLRPLSPEMLRYAVLDTRHLEQLAAILDERLGELGRTDWAREEFERVEAVRWSAGARGAGEVYLRIKGIRKLDRRQLGVLRELARLREGTARRRDVPPFRVMRDEVLLELVRGSPRDRRGLRAVPGLPASWTRDAGASALLEALDRGLTLSDECLPPMPRAEKRKRLNPESEARVRRLCGERDTLAQRLGLEPAVLAPRSLLEQLVVHLERGQELDRVPGLRRWQIALLEPVIQAVST
jgi:ribonuclease D